MADMDLHADAGTWQELAGGRFGPVRCKALLTLDAAGSREVQVGLVEIPPGATLGLHRHRQAKIDFVLSGTLAVRVGPRQADVEPGGCVYYPGDIPHGARAVGPDPARYLATYACERLGHTIDRQPADLASAEA